MASGTDPKISLFSRLHGGPAQRGPGSWSGVDLRKVDPILTDANDLRSGRFKQKAKYGGELLIELGKSRLKQFFQQTRDGNVKGIVLLDLRTLP